MTSLPVMNEALIARMVRNVIAQCGIPSLCSGHRTPFRVCVSDQTTEHRCAPQGFRGQDTHEVRASLRYFAHYRRIQRLLRLGDTIDPKREGTPFQNVPDGGLELVSIHIRHCFDRARFFRTLLRQSACGNKIGSPLFKRRPARRRILAPRSLRSLPQGPCLFSAEILIRVVRHRIEPPSSRRLTEILRSDPFFQGLPDRPIRRWVITLQKSGALPPEFRAKSVWDFTGAFGDSPNPEYETVPLHVLIGPCFQFAPGYQESALKGFLLAVESNVESEIIEGSFNHPQPVSGKGSRNSSSEFLYFTNIRA